MDKPFLGSEAVRAGLLTEHELRTKYRAVYRNVYLADDVPMTAALRARAAWLFAGPDAVLSGVSAAAVLGTKWLDDEAPAEVVRANRHAPDGLKVHSYALAPEDVRDYDGMRITTAARTAFDLGRLLPGSESVPILDALLRQTELDPALVSAMAEANPGIRGISRLESALGRADAGAATPLETQTRLALYGFGIPNLESEILFYDQWGQAIERVAMGWRRWKIAVECDEESDSARYRQWVHWHTADLEARGWSVVWVVKPMLSSGWLGLRARIWQRLRAAQLAERFWARAV